MAGAPIIRAFFDEPTNTVSYLVADPATKEAAVIDPVLDYDHNAGEVDTRSVEAILQAADEADYTVVWTLETHAHADHLSGSPYIKAKTGAKIGIGEHIKDVQRIFRPVFNATDLKTDGSDFDHLFKDGERSRSASFRPKCSTRLATRLPTSPTRSRMRHLSVTQCSCRTSAPRAPISRAAMRISSIGSIKKLMALPPETRLFICHDYKAPGRDEYAWETTVREQREKNIHVKDGVTEDEFVATRTARDSKLSAPRLLLPSIQVNIRAGNFPPAEANGVRYLTIPVKFKNAQAAA